MVTTKFSKWTLLFSTAMKGHWAGATGLAHGFNGKDVQFWHTGCFLKKCLDQRIFIRAGVFTATIILWRHNDSWPILTISNSSIFIMIAQGEVSSANIYASPLNKYQTSNEVGLGIIVSEGFPSPFYNFNSEKPEHFWKFGKHGT
jgi:hypothetical protein